MSAKHTPGRWAVHPIHCGTFYVVPDDHCARPVGGHTDKDEDLRTYAQEICALNRQERHRGEAEQMANAHLIAAAPEMLKVLDSILGSTYERQDGTTGFVEDVLPAYLFTAAYAAIAKATGSADPLDDAITKNGGRFTI